jgi:transketolase
VFALCRSLPPPSSSSPATAVLVAIAVEELHESLLAWEAELTRMEEALATTEEKAVISEKSLAQVSAALDTELTKAEATWQEYFDKVQAHTARTKHALTLDKILGGKKAELNEREWDLELREAALVEAQDRGSTPGTIAMR